MNIRKSIKGISLVGFGLLLGAVSMGAMNINTNYDNATQYIKKIFLTTDGTDSGNNKIKLNGSNGSISVSGNATIEGSTNMKDELNMNNNNINNVSKLNGKKADNLATTGRVDVNDDYEANTDNQDLSNVLNKGNTANSNINMNNNNINNVSNIEGEEYCYSPWRTSRTYCSHKIDFNNTRIENVDWSTANDLDSHGNIYCSIGCDDYQDAEDGVIIDSNTCTSRGNYPSGWGDEHPSDYYKEYRYIDGVSEGGQWNYSCNNGGGDNDQKYYIVEVKCNLDSLSIDC